MLASRSDLIDILSNGDELHWSEEVLFHLCNTEGLDGIFSVKVTREVLKVPADSTPSELVVCWFNIYLPGKLAYWTKTRHPLSSLFLAVVCSDTEGLFSCVPLPNLHPTENTVCLNVRYHSDRKHQEEGFVLKNMNSSPDLESPAS